MLRGLARFVFGMVFREVELAGAERLPASGPAIVIANHSNSLIDGGLLLGYLPRMPRFLAASTVWDYRPVAPIMTASGSVKVFRQQDGRAHEGSLENSFAEAAALLADGGVLAVFPEGRTHDHPAMLPFKTGTARIIAFTRERYGDIDIPVVPVGIDYARKNRFRTRACFTFGPAIRVTPGASAAAAREGDGMREATAELRRALGAVAPDFADPEEARAMTLAGEMLALEGAPDGARASGPAPALCRVAAERRALGDRLRGIGDAQAAAELRAALDAYARALDAAGLADHEVAAPAPPRALAAAGLALLAGLPLVLVAAVLSLPQGLALAAISRSKPRDRQLTWMTFGGVVLYPLTWGLWALVSGLAAGVAFGAGPGWAAALAVLAGAPLSAWFALPVCDRGRLLWRGLRARRQMRRAGAELGARRARAAAALAALAASGAGVANAADRSGVPGVADRAGAAGATDRAQSPAHPRAPGPPQDPPQRRPQ